jgi:hypothetical protein
MATAATRVIALDALQLQAWSDEGTASQPVIDSEV